MRDESHGRQRTPRSIFEKSEAFDVFELPTPTVASLRVGAEISSAEMALAFTSPLIKDTTNTTR